MAGGKRMAGEGGVDQVRKSKATATSSHAARRAPWQSEYTEARTAPRSAEAEGVSRSGR